MYQNTPFIYLSQFYFRFLYSQKFIHIPTTRLDFFLILFKLFYIFKEFIFQLPA